MGCFFGENFVVPPFCDDGVHKRRLEIFPELKPCDRCETAMSPVLWYLVFNIGYNITTMLLVKHGSASYFFIINAVKLPLTAFLFSTSLVMGTRAVPLQWTDWVALVILLAGLCMYKYGGKLKKLQDRAMQADSEMPLLEACAEFEQLTERAYPMFGLGPASGFNLEPVLHVERTNWVKTPEQFRGRLIHSLGVARPHEIPSPVLSSGQSSPRSIQFSPRILAQETYSSTGGGGVLVHRRDSSTGGVGASDMDTMARSNTSTKAATSRGFGARGLAKDRGYVPVAAATPAVETCAGGDDLVNDSRS